MQGSCVRLGSTVGSLTALVLLVGCQGKQDQLAYDNFTRVQERHWTQADVTQTFGQPDHVLANRWIYERPDKHLFVYIDFDEDGRVTQKQWIDGPSGKWEDSHDAGAPPKP